MFIHRRCVNEGKASTYIRCWCLWFTVSVTVGQQLCLLLQISPLCQENMRCHFQPSACNLIWAMAKNGSSRCFLAKNGCTLKTIAAESFVGRIWLVNTHHLPFLAKSDRVLPVIATLLSFHPFLVILCFFPVGCARTDQHGPQEQLTAKFRPVDIEILSFSCK